MAGRGEAETRPLVSLIITTRDRASLLPQSVESALRIHGEEFDTEVIVVDDGSVDETPQILARYPRVRIVRTSGLGMVGARNAGIAAVNGDFVAMLDDDDVWSPDAVVAQMAMFRQHPEYASVHALAQRTHADLRPYGQPVPEGPLTSGWIFEELLAYFTQIGTVVTRTEVVRSFGPLDPSLPAMDEWEMFLWVAKRHPVARIEVPVVLFRQRGAPEDQLMHRRFPGVIRVFRRQTRDLPRREQLRLRPVLWRHRGWCASIYLDSRELHLQTGDRASARRSLRYAFAVSPPHAVVEVVRRRRRALAPRAQLV